MVISKRAETRCTHASIVFFDFMLGWVAVLKARLGSEDGWAFGSMVTERQIRLVEIGNASVELVLR